jgi:hypothetical protein
MSSGGFIFPLSGEKNVELPAHLLDISIRRQTAILARFV